MKFLGIDYGAKRVGIALSDDSGTMAFASKVLSTEKNLILEIKNICSENKVEVIVIGESRDFSGKENPIMEEINVFKKILEAELKLPVYFEPELMTSMEAQHIQGQNAMNDASAAAIILQSYINRKEARSADYENRK